MAGTETTTEIPIRKRLTYSGDGQVVRLDTVRCPENARSVDVDDCLRCERCAGSKSNGEPVLICLHPAAVASNRPKSAAFSAVSISQVMTRDVICVTADLDIDALFELLLDRNINSTPVVDDRGRPIGVASKTDLVRWSFERGDDGELGPGEPRAPELPVRRLPRATVADIMMPLAFTLVENAPLSYAIALMTVEDIHQVPIVSRDGEVVGIISALDVVRWVAGNK
jgi:CBS domain-containing protein